MKLCKIIGVLTALLLVGLFMFYKGEKKDGTIVVPSTPATEHAAKIPVAGSKEFSAAFSKRIKKEKPLTDEEEFRKSMDIVQSAVTQFKENQLRIKENPTGTLARMLEKGISLYKDEAKTTDKISTYRKLKVGDEFPGRAGSRIVDVVDGDKDEDGNFRRVATMTVPKSKVIFRVEAEVAVGPDGSEYVYEQKVANAKRITILAREGVDASQIKELGKELGYRISEPCMECIYVADIDDLKATAVSNAIDLFNERDDIVWLANQDGLDTPTSGPVYPNDPLFSPIGVRKGTEAFRYPSPPLSPNESKPVGFEPFNLSVFWPLGEEKSGTDAAKDDLANPFTEFYNVSLADLNAQRSKYTGVDGSPEAVAYFDRILRNYTKLDAHQFQSALGKWDLNVDIDWLRYIMVYNTDNGYCQSCWATPKKPLENWEVIPANVQNVDIDAPEAWEIRSSASYFDTEKNKLVDVIVAVIDSGIDYRHDDLKDNMWLNLAEAQGKPGEDDDGNGFIDDIYGIDPVNEPNNGTWVAEDQRKLPGNDENPDGPMDDYLHGTHCAGIIGARGNNGIGTVGVCWSVKLMALKAGDQTTVATVEQIRCMEYARDNGASVCNMSFGGWSDAPGDPVRLVAFESLRRKGIICSISAGNNDLPIPRPVDDKLTYPVSYPSDNIVGVGATSASGHRAVYSNHNTPSSTHIDIGAPGGSAIWAYTNKDGVAKAGSKAFDPENTGVSPFAFPPTPPNLRVLNWSIWSTYPLVKDANGDGTLRGNNKVDDYMAIDGTSMAAPQVSGALALLIAEAPKKSYKDIIQILLGNAEQDSRLLKHPPKFEDFINSPFKVWNTGGRLNIGRAMAFVSNLSLLESSGADLTKVNASDGEYADKILISWPLVSGFPVNYYQIWRSPTSLTKDARPIATIPSSKFANGLSFGYYYDRDTGRQEDDRTLFVKNGLEVILPANSTENIAHHLDHDYSAPELGVNVKYHQYRYWVRTISDAKLDTARPLQYPNASSQNPRLASYAISPWSNMTIGHRKAPLPAPAIVNAKDKAYTDKISIQWSPIKGASAFYIYRSDDASKENSKLLAVVSGQEYTFQDELDGFISRAPTGSVQYIGQEFKNAAASRFGRVPGMPGIEPEKVYYYWVRSEAETLVHPGDKVATRFLSPQYSRFGRGSTRVDSESGLGVIQDLRASYNMYTDRIELHWSQVFKATDYEVWRSETPHRADAKKLVDVIRNNKTFSLSSSYTDKPEDQRGLVKRSTPYWWPDIAPYPLPPFATFDKNVNPAPDKANWPTYRPNPEEYVLGADGIYGHPLELEKVYWYWVRPIQDELEKNGALVPSPLIGPDPIRRWEQSYDPVQQDSRLDNTGSESWGWVTGAFSNSARGRRMRAPAPGLAVQVQIGFDSGGKLVTEDQGAGSGSVVNSLSSVLVSRMNSADYRIDSETNDAAVRLKNARGNTQFTTVTQPSLRAVSSFTMEYKVPDKESQFSFKYKFSEMQKGAESILVYVNGIQVWRKTANSSNVKKYVDSQPIDLIDFTNQTIKIKFVLETDENTSLKQEAWIDTVLFADYQVQPSWYAVSVPNENQLINPALGFKGSNVSELYSWKNGDYKLNSAAVSMTPGVGYWVFLPTKYDTLKLSGTTASGPALKLPESGWNFVGPLKTVPVTDYASQIEGTVWTWNSRKSTYEPAGETLVPNNAYWIYRK